jgi:hypothetical protein
MFQVRFFRQNGGQVSGTELLAEVKNELIVLGEITRWESNIAMENDPFIDDVPIKMVIVHGYVKQPKGNYCVECC